MKSFNCIYDPKVAEQPQTMLFEKISLEEVGGDIPPDPFPSPPSLPSPPLSPLSSPLSPLSLLSPLPLLLLLPPLPTPAAQAEN